MIELNFFERKERNVLPHFMVLFFFVGVIVISIYFVIMHGVYTRQDASNLQILEQRSEQVALSREMEQIEQMTVQNNQAIVALENEHYPIVFLTEDIAGIISDDEEVVVSFQLTVTNEVLLQVDHNGIDDSSELIADLEQIPYISRVNLIRLEQQTQEEETVLIDLTLELNEAVLREVAAE